MFIDIIIWIIQIILVPAVAPLCVGIIRKIKAKLQNRQGAGIFQPYQDLWKLFHKDEVISKDASWIFRCAPYIVFTVTIIIGASIPLFASFINNTVTGDLLIIIYTLAIGTFFLALAGIDTGSAFGGFGSSREMTVAALAEGGFIFSLLTVALISGSTNVFTISQTGLLYQSQYLLSGTLAFFGFFIVLLAETARFPFDNPATHLELTMIHEAMILEYSGKKLALMEWASANKLLIFIALASNLFFPLGIAQSAGISAVMLGMVIFMIKIVIFCLVIAVLESSIAKFRFFRLPDLLIIAFIFNVVAIILIH
ncbi:MAG: formate hydrogenlyase [Candidatus Staskawiczbacteria bacterium RIFCSPLOWO2_01_FULL_38_12b]|uniref:Formate hydrogenlyase n=1 Tax=Candidatus Staskawiczbacteria bacterium RIFCSPLOWO2_01_FULL_38_12b TaxID=1802214 RepID=A0A1G2IEB5_9BACT|nr:MAG: formate hydrogenlyase [Candidatus Staskawiczbacteria bacterium RIFCSPLOWO2_01_FULL_38_12b]QBM02604.1 formate hydrogenlyase subunit 4 [uncultured archaeon]